MYKFKPQKEKDNLIEWIKNYFKYNGNNSKAIIGISGGKDSSIVASLCTEALGKERVIGVIMPNETMHDIDYALELCEYLGIKYYIIPITDIYKNTRKIISERINDEINSVFTNNTPARLRMTVLYGVSALVGGRVANTCNLSEDYIGYSTKYGDSAGDFSPLGNLTVAEVKQIGKLLLPEKFVDKIPEDGLCGKTDEENIGFSYEVLDRYIRENKCEDKEILNKIITMHNRALHKISPIPVYKKKEIL